VVVRNKFSADINITQTAKWLNGYHYTTMNKLHTFAISHYCERARWGLDHAKKPYEEVQWVAGFHKKPIQRLTKNGTNVPILETPSAVIEGSGAILDWCLGPSAEPEFEAHCEQTLGVLVRQFTYAATLRRVDSGVKDSLFTGGSAWQNSLMKAIWPIAIGAIEKQLKAYQNLIPELGNKLNTEFSDIEMRLNKKQFLVGTSLSRTDITVASLIAPIARPRQRPIYGTIQYLEPAQIFIKAWEQRPLFQWARATYESNR
jgi:glutathione S-transferase